MSRMPFRLRMRSSACVAILAIAAAAVVAAPRASEGEPSGAPAPTPAEQVLGLEAMCAANADAMAARQAEQALYDRLGGADRIHEIVAEVVRLHQQNDAIVHTLDGVDVDHLVDGVTQFLVVATGGPGEYTGPDMTTAHAHLQLTNADFLAAGGDVMQAMKNKGCAEPEIQEVVCSFVSLRSLVVIDSEKSLN